MEAQGGASDPELNKGTEKLVTKSSSGDLTPEVSHNPSGEERGVPMPISSLLHVVERRQPLSSVSSLEVHFDLLDLTELTDMSDQELTEVFVDSDEENHNESPSSCALDVPNLQPHSDCRLPGLHHPPLARAGYMRSPSWSRCRKGDVPRDRKRQSDSDGKECAEQPE